MGLGGRLTWRDPQSSVLILEQRYRRLMVLTICPIALMLLETAYTLWATRRENTSGQMVLGAVFNFEKKIAPNEPVGTWPPDRRLHFSWRSRRAGGKRPWGVRERTGGPDPKNVPLGSRGVSQKVNFWGQGNKGRLTSSAVRRRTGEYPAARLLLPGGLCCRVLARWCRPQGCRSPQCGLGAPASIPNRFRSRRPERRTYGCAGLSGQRSAASRVNRRSFPGAPIFRCHPSETSMGVDEGW